MPQTVPTANIGGCDDAELIGIEESAFVPFEDDVANALECNDKGSTIFEDGSVSGSWFTVANDPGKGLRASACPGGIISVYEGNCDDLKCAKTIEVGESGGCEVEWRSSHPASQQHILVRRMDEAGNEPLVLFLEQLA